MKAFLINVTILFFFGINHSHSQILTGTEDSLFSGNFLQTNLYNDVSAANLYSIANYNYNLGKFGVTVGNNYISNVSKLNQNFFRDYNRFRFLLYYNVKNNIDAGIGFNNVFLTDEKNVETNKNNTSFYFADLNVRFNNNVFLDTKLGYRTEDQIGEISSGFSGIITGQADNFFYRDYVINANTILFYENLYKKNNHNYDVNLSVYKRFTSEADNNGTIRFYNLRNDFFFPATPGIANLYNVLNNIETRTENYFFAGDNLNYSFTQNLQLNVNGSYLNREVNKEFKYRSSPSNVLLENTYDTKILEDNLEFSGSVIYFPYKLNSQLKLIYSERSENHSLINIAGLTPVQISELEKAEKSKNNNSKRASVIADILYMFSNTNSFGFSGSSTLFRYDTDYDQNFDDRDEVENIASFMHSHNNLINFSIQTRFELIFSDLNYIYSQRSANNYSNKIYRLSTQSIFSPARNFTTNNFVQVLANYTVYDFEDIISQIQSFSYRQLLIADTTSYNFNRNLALNFTGILKYYQQGEFNNSNFSEKPIAFFVEQLFNPILNYYFGPSANAGIGYKYFEQNRYIYENSEKQLTRTYRSFGPMAQINLYFSKNSLMNILGGIDYTRLSNSTQDNNSIYLTMNILWNI